MSIFDKLAFEDDLHRSPIGILTVDYGGLELDEMVELYDRTLTSLLDKHCPRWKIQIRNNLLSLAMV